MWGLIIKFFCIIVIVLFNSCVYKETNINIREGEFKKIDGFYILNLPYELEVTDELVFDEDTPYAIDIIEIRTNRRKIYATEYLSFVELRTSFRTHKIEKTEHFITMFWILVEPGKLYWDDGRWTIFVEIAPNNFVYRKNAYLVSKRMKVLEIKYRIILPYPGLSIENLYDINYEHKRYTEEYTLRVDLSNI
jgi:hypothetical protein